VQIRKDVQDAILRKIQQSESNFDRASLDVSGDLKARHSGDDSRISGGVVKIDA
jgi:hypothetical protein